MSEEHPIIAITGSSGAGSRAVSRAFNHILWREKIKAAYIQGNAFHRFDRKQMQTELRNALEENRTLSHFGPDGNMLDKLESLFFQYAATGTGKRRYYLHSAEDAEKWDQEPGTFTPWEDIEDGGDMLLYRGLHGGAIEGDVDISQYPDLLIGIAPITNLEWIRKIARDTTRRGYPAEEVRQSILRRMRDYVHHITPQFARTHINLQMVTTIDTSDPFCLSEVPLEDECLVVIHFQKGPRPDFEKLLYMIPGAFMSRPDTIVVPGGKKMLAIEVILTPMIHAMVKRSRDLRGIEQIPEDYAGGVLGHL